MDNRVIERTIVGVGLYANGKLRRQRVEAANNE